MVVLREMAGQPEPAGHRHCGRSWPPGPALPVVLEEDDQARRSEDQLQLLEEEDGEGGGGAREWS